MPREEIGIGGGARVLRAFFYHGETNPVNAGLVLARVKLGWGGNLLSGNIAHSSHSSSAGSSPSKTSRLINVISLNAGIDAQRRK